MTTDTVLLRVTCVMTVMTVETTVMNKTVVCSFFKHFIHRTLIDEINEHKIILSRNFTCKSFPKEDREINCC